MPSHKTGSGTVPAVDGTEAGCEKERTVRIPMDNAGHRAGVLFMQGIFTFARRSEGLKDGGDYTLA